MPDREIHLDIDFDNLTTQDIETLYKLARQRKLMVNDLKETLKEEERVFNFLKHKILEALSALGLDSSKINDVAIATRTRKTVANVKDWDAFYEWIHEQNVPELLQKRLLLSGIQEYFDRGETIPGVEDEEVFDLNFTVLSN